MRASAADRSNSARAPRSPSVHKQCEGTSTVLVLELVVVLAGSTCTCTGTSAVVDY